MIYPTWHEVEKTFINHISHYKDRGGEDALLHLRAEESVEVQYAGRVALELFQNALDRADKNCLVQFEDNCLVVANDGFGLSVNSDFDYSNQNEHMRRSDFHALCALHASNKTVEQNFGNKGIGFRSVFAVSNRVEVWSRLQDGGWWGLELRTKCDPSKWQSSASPALDNMVREISTSGLRPSFHLPRLLKSSSGPCLGLDNFSTVVCLPIPETNRDHIDQIATEVAALNATRLHFITLRKDRTDLAITIGRRSDASTETNWENKGVKEFPELSALAEKARLHGLVRPRIALRWEKDIGTTLVNQSTGRFYNYLPTQLRTGLPIDIHGDFQVKADRESMDMKKDNDVGRYNLELLKRVANLHVESLVAESQSPSARMDFWQLASKPKGAPAEWLEVLRDALFPDKSFVIWVKMAKSYFRESQSLSDHRQSYTEFWDSSLQWIEGICGCGSHTATWAFKASELCNLLKTQKIGLIPIQTIDGWDAVALPSKGESEVRRDDSRIFVNTDKNAMGAVIPTALINRGRSVTDFDVGPWLSPMGAVPFWAPVVLRELRQLAQDPKKTDYGSPLTAAFQKELLLFAKTLLDRVKEPKSESLHFAWRACGNAESGQMGRALATLFLPTKASMWEPARQLTVDRVDFDFFGHGVITEELLIWLGVAPEFGVPLVEGGDDGCVMPQALPPSLQLAGTDQLKLFPLEPLMANLTIDQVAKSMAVLPTDCSFTGHLSSVFSKLSEAEWLPRDLMQTDPHVAPLNSLLAPRDVLVGVNINKDQRCKFLARLKNEPVYETLLLKRLGAIPSLDHEFATQRSLAFLYDLEERYPNSPDDLRPELRRHFISLVEVLVSKLSVDTTDIEQTPRVPVLVEQNNKYHWHSEFDDIAWISIGSDKNELRKFFRDLRLVVGDYRKGLPELLKVKRVSLNKAVKYKDIVNNSQIAVNLVGSLKPLIPVFCALATISRLTIAPNLTDRATRAWYGSGYDHLVHTNDAYIEVSAVEAERKTDWLLNKFEDVIYLRNRIEDEPGQIFFDTKKVEGPPLRNFGEALALQLANNPALGPIFAEALAAHASDVAALANESDDGNALKSFLERRHATEETQRWEIELRPLTPEQKIQIINSLQKWVKSPASCLKSGSISSNDVLAEIAIKSVAEFEINIGIGLPPALCIHLPSVTIAQDNYDNWEAWAKNWRKRLLVWVAHTSQSNPEDIESSLKAHVDIALKNLHFDALAEVTTWLESIDLKGQPIGSLVETLDSFIPEAFQPVQNAPVDYASSCWATVTGTPGGTQAGPEGKVELQDVIDEQIAKSAWGIQAECALLNWVIENTSRVLKNNPKGHDTLLSALKPGSMTHQIVSKELAAANYARALHVAELWSGLGFDIIGLEEDGTTHECKVVRYECKGLPTSAPRIRVHLSRREIGVARKVTRDGPGLWKLIGVEPTGTAIDLTHAIHDLLASDSTILKSLHDKGLEHDGLRLVIQRPVVQ